MGDKVYIVKRDTSYEALQYIDEFKDKMDQFVKKHPSFSYDVDMTRSGKKWQIKVKVIEDE